MTGPETHCLLVSGDVVVDHHLYAGLRDAPTTDGKRGVHDVRECGGAALLQNMLRAALKRAQPETWRVELGVAAPDPHEPPRGHHAYAVWSPFAKSLDDDKQQVWRVSKRMGYGDTDVEPATAEAGKAFRPGPAPHLQPARLLVLDDAGSTFRQAKHQDCWRLPSEPADHPEWIVLKISRPVARGDLWHALASRFSDRLICVVAADELRGECAQISKGLSWERTVEDLRAALLENPSLGPLTQCRHLVVWFSADGALWLDQTAPDAPAARLVFDARGGEGGWSASHDGEVFGYSVNMTSAIAFAWARALQAGATPGAEAFAAAIQRGLAAMRDLVENGHGPLAAPTANAAPRGFPIARLAPLIAEAKPAFAQAHVPWPSANGPLLVSDRPWLIAESSQIPPGLAIRPSLAGLARRYVLRGASAFKSLPMARFLKLDTIDRAEIETLRALHAKMRDYEKEPRPRQPLSFGVFGPPGAGKSFGVKQIAAQVFGAKAWLEFNLSQFAGAADLIGAFHQVRDAVLSGLTPVAFWDEFDSDSHRWLKDLLAPMQDGRFQEGQVSHWIGKCVFIFAGGTCRTYEEFGALGRGGGDAAKQFKLRKGPDFHSRLDGYFNVVGPNPRALPGTDEPDPADICFPLRRALLIRATLGRGDDVKLDFDSDLLDALLLVPKYEHGARSLEKLVAPLRPEDGATIRRSALPPPAQIAMHVDAAAFDRLLKRNDGFLASRMIEKLAAIIHENYRATSKTNETHVAENFARPYAGLAPVDKEPNLAAARRIPRNLAMVGARLVEFAAPASADDPSPEDMRKYLDFHIEILAEEEHIGWREERHAAGWRHGERRDDENLLSPLLVAYEELEDAQKEKDRSTIRNIPEVVKQAGYRIVWLRGDG